MPQRRTGRRETTFFLALWLDCQYAPCRDVIHRENVVPDGNFPTLEAGQERIVALGKAKVRRKCRVIALGSERKLKLMRVDATGMVSEDGPCVPTRRECLHHYAEATRRSEAQAATDTVAFNDMFAEGSAQRIAPEQVDLRPDEGIPSQLSATVAEVEEMARKLPANPTVDQLRQVLWSLPCLRQQNDYEKPLVPGIKCFINKHVQTALHKQFLRHNKHGLYMSAILRHLVPERILALPNLTARGMCKPGTLGIPKPIYEALRCYMENMGMSTKNLAHRINGIIDTCRGTQRVHVQRGTSGAAVGTPVGLNVQVEDQQHLVNAGPPLQLQCAGPLSSQGLQLMQPYEEAPTSVSDVLANVREQLYQ